MEKDKEQIKVETSFNSLLEELNAKIELEKDPELLSIYKNALLRLLVRKSESESFRRSTTIEEVDNRDKKIYFDKLFQAVNGISFGGFDYYFTEDMGKELKSGHEFSKEGLSFDMLINQDHLYKLKNTVNCVESISFISYTDDNNQDRYAIWYKDSPVYINLIPFVRNKDNTITFDETSIIPVKKDKKYKKLSYRLLKK